MSANCFVFFYVSRIELQLQAKRLISYDLEYAYNCSHNKRSILLLLGRLIQSEQSTKEDQRAEIIPIGTLHSYNVALTSMQRHNVAWTLMPRCLSVMSLLGQIMKITIYLSTCPAKNQAGGGTS